MSRTAPAATGVSRSPRPPTRRRKLRGADGAATVDAPTWRGRAARLQARRRAGADPTGPPSVRGCRPGAGRIERRIRGLLLEPEGAGVGDGRARLREFEHRP